MKILLLGATGYMGRRCASELLRHPEVDALTLAGRDEVKLDQLAERLGGRASISTRRFDIDSGELAEHARDHERIVSCAGPGYKLEPQCVDAAIEAGIDYVSLNDDLDAAQKVATMHAAAVERKVTIVSGCGLAPGLSDQLVGLAAEDLDEVEEIEISLAGSSADGGGDATDLHFIAMLDRGARNGEEVPERGARAPHSVYFPDPVGWVETFPCNHPEQIALERAHPGLGMFRFRIGLGEKAVMDIVRAGIATRLTSGELRRKLWLKSAQPLRPLLEKLSPKAGPWTSLRVDVRGRRDGRNRTISYGVVDHLANLASISIAQAAVSLPRDEPFGVLGPAEAFEPRSFLRKVAGRGLTFARLEPHNL